jgi:glycosyltransferase involved in cell wall biosynthesis
MKVLIIQETVIRFDASFVQHLRRAGVDVRFLYKSPKIGGAQPQLDYPASFLPLRGRLDFRSLLGLRKIINEFKPDVIHARAAKNCFLAIMAQWPRKRARLVLLRGALRNINPFSPSDRLLFRSHWVDVFQSVSQAIADSLVRAGIPEGRVAVAADRGYELAWFKDLPAPPDLVEKTRRYRIGAIANYRKVKGLEYLVQAVDILVERGVDLELVWVGKDKNSGLAAFMRQAKARDSIRMLGPVPSPWGILKTFDCLVVPSISEGLGLVSIESMACGVPVVASRVGGLAETIQHGQNGLLVSPANSVELADAIQRLLTDRILTEEIRRRGVETFHERFTTEKVSTQFLEVYHQAMATTKPDNAYFG